MWHPLQLPGVQVEHGDVRRRHRGVRYQRGMCPSMGERERREPGVGTQHGLPERNLVGGHPVPATITVADRTAVQDAEPVGGVRAVLAGDEPTRRSLAEHEVGADGDDLPAADAVVDLSRRRVDQEDARVVSQRVPRALADDPVGRHAYGQHALRQPHRLAAGQWPEHGAALRTAGRQVHGPRSCWSADQVVDPAGHLDPPRLPVP